MSSLTTFKVIVRKYDVVKINIFLFEIKYVSLHIYTKQGSYHDRFIFNADFCIKRYFLRNYENKRRLTY